MLGVSPSSVKRDWLVAKTWIRRHCPARRRAVDAERWSRVTALFDQARELPAGDARRLAAIGSAQTRTCARRSLGLLATYDDDPELPRVARRTCARPPTPWAGSRDGNGWRDRRLGAYRLVREIGRGGMGVVYEAVRDDAEFERRVAIKLLPFWWGAPALSERFRFERHVLAGPRPPDIARLLDAGTTDDGRAVLSSWSSSTGSRSTLWCRERRLTRAPARRAALRRLCGRRSRPSDTWSSIATSSPATSSSRRRPAEAARFRHRHAGVRGRGPEPRAPPGRGSTGSRSSTPARSRCAASA